MLGMFGSGGKKFKHPDWFYQIDDLDKEFELIANKKSKLSNSQRKYLIRLAEKLKEKQITEDE